MHARLGIAAAAVTRVVSTMPVLAGALALLLVAGGSVGVTLATVPSGDGRISACYQKSDGSLRVVDTANGEGCRKRERALVWNQRGARGAAGIDGAAGTTGATGAQGDQGYQGAPGAQGPVGPRGLHGERGWPGEQGPPGLARAGAMYWTDGHGPQSLSDGPDPFAPGPSPSTLVASLLVPRAGTFAISGNVLVKYDGGATQYSAECGVSDALDLQLSVRIKVVGSTDAAQQVLHVDAHGTWENPGRWIYLRCVDTAAAPAAVVSATMTATEMSSITAG